MREIIDNRISMIKIDHVAGHSGCYGNEEAHRLANEAAEAQRRRERSNNRNRRNERENVAYIGTVFCNNE